MRGPRLEIRETAEGLEFRVLPPPSAGALIAERMSVARFATLNGRVTGATMVLGLAMWLLTAAPWLLVVAQLAWLVMMAGAVNAAGCCLLMLLGRNRP